MNERARGAIRQIDTLVQRLVKDRDVAQDHVLAHSLEQIRSRAAETGGGTSAEDYQIEISRMLFQRGQQRAAQLEGLPYPIYDHLQGLAENEEGPWAPALPARPVVAGRKWRLLGNDVGLPIGIPASVLTMNSTWVAAHAQNGYNVLTYKTVRSRTRLPHAPPNWIFVSSPISALSPDDLGTNLEAIGDISTWPASFSHLSTANSFGVPSKSPEEWVPDVRRALSLLADDQLLIVSVMGTFEELRGDALVDDFVKVAGMAAETGVRAIELNLSCPNGLVNGEVVRPLFQDASMVESVVKAVRESLDPTVALVAKFGYLDTDDLITTLDPVVELLDGVSGINTLQVPVRDYTGAYAFSGVDGNVRQEAGLSGSALRRLALRFVSDVARLRRDRGLFFDIIGMGGVVTSADAIAMYEAGASGVQTASGAFFNPYFAKKLVDESGESFPRHDAVDFVDLDEIARSVLIALERRGLASAGTLAAGLALDPGTVETVVRLLVDKGKVRAEAARESRDELGPEMRSMRLYSSV